MKVCSQCNFENDETRIFCQNCGTRLGDVPAAASGEAPKTGKLFIPQSQQAPTSVRKPIKPVRLSGEREGGRRKGSLTGFLVSTLLSAAVIAAIIQMVRPPDNVPAPVTANPKQAGDLFATVSATSTSPYARNLVVLETQINNYLAARILPPAEDEGSKFQPRFSRAYVLLGTGDYRFFVQEDVLGFPLYVALIQQPKATASGLTVETVGGSVGRMPIHPKLLPLISRLIDPIVSTLDDAKAPLASANAILVQPSGVTLNWPGTTKKP